MIDPGVIFDKLVGMFRPYNDGEFVIEDGPGIMGPDDRAMIGCTTYFPKKWLVEDFDFTEEEAGWLIEAVKEHASRTDR